MTLVEFVRDMAERSGWSEVEVHSDTFVSLPFNTDEGKVSVFIRPCGELAGQTVLEFSSSGIPVPDDPETQLSFMRLFMERNGNMLQGHWGIEETSDGPKFTVFASQIAATMDPPEFQAATGAVLSEFEHFLGVLRKRFQQDSIDF